MEAVLKIVMWFFIIAFSITLAGLAYFEISDYLERRKWAKRYLKSMEKRGVV